MNIPVSRFHALGLLKFMRPQKLLSAHDPWTDMFGHQMQVGGKWLWKRSMDKDQQTIKIHRITHMGTSFKLPRAIWESPALCVVQDTMADWIMVAWANREGEAVSLTKHPSYTYTCLRCANPRSRFDTPKHWTSRADSIRYEEQEHVMTVQNEISPMSTWFISFLPVKWLLIRRHFQISWWSCLIVKDTCLLTSSSVRLSG